MDEESKSMQQSKSSSLTEKMEKNLSFLRELIKRQEAIANKMVGHEVEDAKEKEKHEPMGWLGQLEYQVQIFAELNGSLEHQISRLEGI